MATSTIHRIRYAIVFNRRTNVKTKTIEKPIEIRAYQKGSSPVYIKTEIRIQPDQWDYSNKRINFKHPLSDILNKRIADQLFEIEQYELAMIRRYNRSFPVKRIKEYKAGINTDYHNFTQFWREELKHSTDKPKTIKTHKTHLKTFHEFNKRKDVYFEDVTVRLVKRYDSYLKKKETIVSQNTIHNYHKTVKAYINKAIAEGLIKENPYDKYKIKRERDENIKREWLTLEEVQRIEQLEFTEEERHLGRIRDFMLLCIWCGFRYSQASLLAPKHIKHTKDGMEIEILKSPKNNKRIFMPLYLLGTKNEQGRTKPEQLVKDLLDRRHKEAEGNKVFEEMPFLDLTGQYINREIKGLAKLANIDKNITTHTGRRTFMDLMAVEFGLPMPLVQKLAHHSDIKTTMKYIKQDDTAIKRQLERVNIKF